MKALRPGVVVLLGAIAIVLVISAAGVFAFDRLFTTTTVPVTAPQAASVGLPPAVEEPTLHFRVLSTRGVAEKHRTSGAWAPLAVGDELGADDEVRTEATGQVELSLGVGSVITVAASTELRVAELRPALHQLQLKRGRLAATYDPDGKRVLQIEDDSGKTVVVTRGAAFSVLASGQALAVVTQTGSVSLQAAGAATEVGPGQQAHTYGGSAPSPVTPIRAEVLLKIARAGRPTSTLCTEVKGTVEVGTEVQVDGQAVGVDGAGRFSVKVPRREGQVSARVAVRDVSGRPRETLVPCAAPAAVESHLEVELRWGSPAAATAPGR
ncbi:MAG: FecR domain-containing protein [Archangium sp.]|nr:FecR domain-containing protein [Archangium sp.]